MINVVSTVSASIFKLPVLPNIFPKQIHLLNKFIILVTLFHCQNTGAISGWKKIKIMYYLSSKCEVFMEAYVLKNH